MALPNFILRSATTNANAPFSLGHAFKQGDVPAGSEVVADIADFQCYGTTTWPDGSLKFATLSGRTAITAGVAKNVTLSLGASSGGTDLTITDLKATGVTAAMTAGGYGSASWSGTDWDTPFKTVVSGPKMSSWQFRKQIGTDAHAVAWLEVRLWSGGEVDVLPAVENGYLKVIAPSARNATYTFTLGGVVRFNAAIDLRHHSRTPLISGAGLTHWLGTDPAVSPRLDVAYLQATELVPTYSASRSATGLGLVATFTPLDKCNFIYDNDNMTESGYQRPIGLLPQHDVAYLVCNDQPELLFAAVVRNGYAAGRYPIHYRDELTNLPPKFSDHQTLALSDNSGLAHSGGSSTGNLTPVTAGGVTANWDLAHSPAVGFMAHLLTGQQYHLDTMMFALTASWLNAPNTNSTYTSPANTTRLLPLYGSIQTRSLAWGMRHLAHALVQMPDSDDVLRPELVYLAETINDHFYDTYVAQPNNPYGIVQPGEDIYGPTGKQIISIWQQDFITAAFGYAVSLGLPISSANRAKLYAFFQWKAKSAVMRLGAQGDYWYINASVYQLSIGSSTGQPTYQNGTGPWLPSDEAVYDEAMTLGTTPSWKSSAEGVLAGEYSSDNWSRAMWGNLHPAIAYAVRHGVPGAADGYARMVGASNYIDIESGFSLYPVWSVAPASIGAVVVTGESFSGDCVRAYTSDYFPGKVVAGHRGLGVPASAIPSSGTHGPGYAYNDLSLPADANKAIMGRVIVRPVTGNLVTYEDTSFAFTPASTGTESFQYQLYVDGVAVGTPRTVLLNSGAVAVAPGAPSVTLVAGNGVVFATVTPPSSNGGATVTSYTVTLSNGQSASGAGPTFTISAANGLAVTATATATNLAGTGPSSAVSNAVFPAGSVGGGGADTQGPTMDGAINVDLITHDTLAFSCLPASDNVGVTSYQYSIDGGVSWVDIGTARNAVVGGLAPLTGYSVQMRARDQAGNVSIPISLTLTTLQAPIPTLPPATPAPSNTTRSLEWLRDAAVRWSGNRTDLLPMMDDFIMLAETRIDTDLEARLQMTSTILRTTANLSGVLLPFDLAEIRSLTIPSYGPVGYLDPDSFNSWTAREAVGQPRYFTVTGPYLYMTPTPDAIYDMVCSYRQTIPSLLDAVDGVNWLIRDQPNIYLAAVMVEVINYTKNFADMAIWEGKYQTAIATMNQQDWHVGGSLTMRAG